jgi:hypothetical protein
MDVDVGFGGMRFGCCRAEDRSDAGSGRAGSGMRTGVLWGWGCGGGGGRRTDEDGMVQEWRIGGDRVGAGMRKGWCRNGDLDDAGIRIWMMQE